MAQKEKELNKKYYQNIEKQTKAIKQELVQ
jgi:ribosomal protein L29